MFVDTHCHLDFKLFSGDLQDVISRAKNNGVEVFINPAIDLQSSLQCLAITESTSEIFAAIGVHPNEINVSTASEIINALSLCIGHKKLVAIGEIGLDYYHNLFDHELQKNIFSTQLELAIENHLPVIIHSRDSIKEVLDLINRYYSKPGQSNAFPHNGVIHAFEGDAEEALQAVEYGFLIGVGGPVTYKNSLKKHNLVKMIPISSILLETDSPFLSPEPLRGTRNEPGNIKFIAEKIAKLKECDIKQVEIQTTSNARSLFNIGEEIDLN